MQTIDQNDVDRRVAMLRKLREYLLRQRDSFARYLRVLESEGSDIEHADTERLESHVEMEEAIVREIFSVQKVIQPLEDVYRAIYPNREEELPEVRRSLAILQQKVVARNLENQKLLRRHVEQLRQKIVDIRGRAKVCSPFGSDTTPSYVDIVT